jgi:hypothetical protein
MRFEEVVSALREGREVRRRAWGNYGKMYMKDGELVIEIYDKVVCGIPEYRPAIDWLTICYGVVFKEQPGYPPGFVEALIVVHDL